MSLSKTQREIAETRMAEAQGRPTKICPSCGDIGVTHWVPDHIDPDEERFVAGRYVCGRKK